MAKHELAVFGEDLPAGWKPAVIERLKGVEGVVVGSIAASTGNVLTLQVGGNDLKMGARLNWMVPYDNVSACLIGLMLKRMFGQVTLADHEGNDLLDLKGLKALLVSNSVTFANHGEVDEFDDFSMQLGLKPRLNREILAEYEVMNHFF